MLRKLVLLLVLAGTAGVAQAQVSVTGFVPAAPRILAPRRALPETNVVPDNPAAVMWGIPSRFAFGMLQGQRDPTSAAPSEDFDGNFVGFRYVPEQWAVAIDHIAVDGEYNGYETTVTGAAGAYRMGRNFALGLGLRQGQQKDNANTVDQDAVNAGLSLFLGDSVFLGAGMGRETRDESGGFSDQRTYSMFGLGFFVQGNWNWHLSYDVINAHAFSDGGVSKDGFNRNDVRVQLLAGMLLLSLQDTNIDYDDAGGRLDSQAFDLGWVPVQGFAFGVRIEQTEERNDAGTVIADDQMNAISVAYYY